MSSSRSDAPVLTSGGGTLKQERSRPRRQAKMCTIGQAERNTGMSMGIASERAKSQQRAVDFSETDARAKKELAPSPGDIGRASVLKKSTTARGRSVKGTMAGPPRDTSLASKLCAAADAEYETSALWRIGAVPARGPVIAPPPHPPSRPRTLAKRPTRPDAASDLLLTAPGTASRVTGHKIRRDDPSTWNGESLALSKRQVASVRAQSSGRARRAILEQRRAEGLSSHQTHTTGHRDHGAAAVHYRSLLHHGADSAPQSADGGGDFRSGTHQHDHDATSQLSGTSAARRPAAAERPQTAGWSFSNAPRFAALSGVPALGAAADGGPASSGPVDDAGVRRHVPAPKMTVQMPTSVFEEHRRARASSARGLRRAPSDFDSSRRHPLTNLRGCVHSRLLPAKAIQ